MKKILIVEDQKLIVRSLELGLRKNFDVTCIQNFSKASKFDITKYDLVLLDIGLQDGSGMDLYKIYKSYKDIPIIFLTANDQEQTIVKAFDMGASDYLTKPFKFGELLARINRLLPKTLNFRDIEIDESNYKVYRLGKEIQIRGREYELLRYLILNKNKVVTRDQLMQLWEINDHFINDNTLTVALNRLRKKLGLSQLKTIKNIGYILDEKE